MREKPALTDAQIQAGLLQQYGLPAAEVTFLPRGGDINAAVYRILARDGAPYFLKLRRGSVTDISLRVPRFLFDSGISVVIPPILTSSRQLWTQLADFTAILYPYVAGHNAFETPLTAGQWVDFGAALRAVHAAALPIELTGRLPRETYTPEARERALALLKRVQQAVFTDPIAAQYAAFLAVKAAEIRVIVQKAGQFGAILQAQAPNLVLCHSDLHAGNLLMDAQSHLYLVDWDAPILAAKERDLMFIGGGVGGAWYAPEEAALFYQGYGSMQINPVALAYYRFERILQDLAEWGELVLLTGQGGQDRARALMGLKRWFQPHEVVEMAYQAEKMVPPHLR